MEFARSDETITWRSYSDDELKIRIDVPEGWGIEPHPELSSRLGHITLRGPKSGDAYSLPNRKDGLPQQLHHQIELGYSFLEIPLGSDLLAWTKEEKCRNDVFTGWFDAEIFEDAAGRVHVVGLSSQHTNMKRGRIVWQLSANFGRDEGPNGANAIYLRILESLSFLSDAPLTLSQLTGSSHSEPRYVPETAQLWRNMCNDLD